MKVILLIDGTVEKVELVPSSLLSRSVLARILGERVRIRIEAEESE